MSIGYIQNIQQDHHPILNTGFSLAHVCFDTIFDKMTTKHNDNFRGQERKNMKISFSGENPVIQKQGKGRDLGTQQTFFCGSDRQEDG